MPMSSLAKRSASCVLFAASVLATIACGKAEETPAQSVAAAQSTDGGLCAEWPAQADTYDASGPTGCIPRAETTLNGENVCDGATEYALDCAAAPDPGLGCRTAAVFPGHGPVLCCPCRR